MKLKLLIPIILLSFLLLGCASNTTEETVKVVPAPAAPENAITTEAPIESVDLDLRVVDKQIDPQTITIDTDTVLSIKVHNLGEESIRFEIPEDGSIASIDIEEGKSNLVSVTPDSKGSIPVEIDGSVVGEIVVN